MRLAYVAIHLGQTIMNGGVGHKIQSQFGWWQNMGHEARLFLHTPDMLELPHTDTFHYSLNHGSGLAGGVKREYDRSKTLDHLIAAVRAYRPDCIYFRYGLFTLPLQNLFRIAPTVIEINTNDVSEYKLRGSFYAAFNRLTRRITLGSSSGMITVSHEIAHYPENTAFKKPIRVIANGVDLNQVQPLPAPNNPTPCLGFVGSPGYSWQGIDKLLELARHYPDLTIEVIGFQASDIDQDIPSNVHMHGFVSREQVRQILSRTDVSFGSLALYRRNVYETSTLKVCESLGYGIPMILGYQDTNLIDTNFDFILQIPNSEDNMTTCGEQVRDFAYAMRGKRADREALRPLIDQRVKEEQRLAFFASLFS